MVCKWRWLLQSDQEIKKILQWGLRGIVRFTETSTRLHAQWEVRTKPWRFWGFQAARLKLRFSWGASTAFGWGWGWATFCRWDFLGFFWYYSHSDIQSVDTIHWTGRDRIDGDLKEHIPDPTLLVVSRATVANPRLTFVTIFISRRGRPPIYHTFISVCICVFE